MGGIEGLRLPLLALELLALDPFERALLVRAGAVRAGSDEVEVVFYSTWWFTLVPGHAHGPEVVRSRFNDAHPPTLSLARAGAPPPPAPPPPPPPPPTSSPPMNLADPLASPSVGGGVRVQTCLHDSRGQPGRPLARWHRVFAGAGGRAARRRRKPSFPSCTGHSCCSVAGS